MRAILTLGLVLVLSSTAHADENDPTWLAGPVLGFSWSKSTEAERPAHGAYQNARGFLGAEAGIGWLFERLNVGMTNRGGEVFSYLEADPWLYLGASAGAGYGSETGFHGIVGIWEGIPLPLGSGSYPCNASRPVLTISAGLRWTGAIELYLAPKIGTMPEVCIG